MYGMSGGASRVRAPEQTGRSVVSPSSRARYGQTAAVTDRLDALARATAELEPPYAVLDLDAFDANAAELTRRAAGRATIRLASKSLRVRALLARAAVREGYAGTLAFTLPEALWLAEGGGAVGDDVLIGYPTTHRAGLRRLAAEEALRSRVTLMVDSVAHLDLVDDVLGAGHPAIKVCLDSWSERRQLQVPEVAGPLIHDPFFQPPKAPYWSASTWMRR